MNVPKPAEVALSPPDTGRAGERSSLGTQDSKPTTDIEHLAVDHTPQGSNTISVDSADVEFVEGGIEGWKVVFGCALISVSTIGKYLLQGDAPRGLTIHLGWK